MHDHEGALGSFISRRENACVARSKLSFPFATRSSSSSRACLHQKCWCHDNVFQHWSWKHFTKTSSAIQLMEIFYRCYYNHRVLGKLHVQSSDTVAEVLARIHDKEGCSIAPQDCRFFSDSLLFYHSNRMQKDRTLADYNVREESLLSSMCWRRPSQSKPEFDASDEIIVKFPDGMKKSYMGFSCSSTMSDLKIAIEREGGPKRDEYTFSTRFPTCGDGGAVDDAIHEFFRDNQTIRFFLWCAHCGYSRKMTADTTQQFASFKVYAVTVTQGLCDSAFFFPLNSTMGNIKEGKSSYTLGIGQRMRIQDPHLFPGDKSSCWVPCTARKEGALSFTVSDEQKARISGDNGNCLTAIALGSVIVTAIFQPRQPTSLERGSAYPPARATFKVHLLHVTNRSVFPVTFPDGSQQNYQGFICCRDKVLLLKQRIADQRDAKLRPPVEQQRLRFKGVELRDDDTLCNVFVHDESYELSHTALSIELEMLTAAVYCVRFTDGCTRRFGGFYKESATIGQLASIVATGEGCVDDKLEPRALGHRPRLMSRGVICRDEDLCEAFRVGGVGDGAAEHCVFDVVTCPLLSKPAFNGRISRSLTRSPSAALLLPFEIQTFLHPDAA
jgi:hypothetical protein